MLVNYYSYGHPHDTEVLARPVSSQSQYVISPSATTLRAAPVLTALTPMRTYAGATLSGQAGSPTDVKNVKLFSHLTPNGASANSTSPVQHAHYVVSTNEEDMDVVQTLAGLHTTDRPPTGRSQGLIIISQDEDGEMVVQKNESVSLEKGEEKMLKKIAKTATVRPLKSDKDAAYASLDTDILQKLVRYEGEEATKKITMKELRHVIPLLIMRCFNMTEEPYQRKVRGMWTEKPPDWPTNIPFCDPNNKKDLGKPKKSTLLTMFEYLRQIYTDSNVGALERYKARKSISSPRPIMEAMEMVTTTTAAMPSSVPSTSLGLIGAGRLGEPVVATPYTTISLRDHDSPSPPTPQVIQVQPMPPTPPVQTMELSSFSELNQDWDPEEESMSRINNKMKWLKHSQLLADRETNMLHMIENVISKMYQVRSQDHLFFLEIVHDFEATLDTVRVTGELQEKSIYKWKEFHENHQGVPDVAASEQVLDITEDTVACEPLGLGREEEVITDNNIVVSIITKDPDSSKDEQENLHAPAHILDTFSQEPAYNDPASYPGTNLQEIPYKNDNDIYPTDYNQQYREDHYKKDSEEYGNGMNSVLTVEPDLTSELGNLLKSSLHMTEDVNYNSQHPSSSLPTGGSTSPTGSVQLPDASNADIFPLSSEASDIMEEGEKFFRGGTFLIEEVDGGGQAQAPSTRFVSIAEQGLNNTHIIQQEQITAFNMFNNTINLEKLKIPSHSDDSQKAEKVRNMAHAFYLLQKKQPQKTERPIQAAPPPILNAGYNQVIPLVVEDMEKEVLIDDQPNRKKRRTIKRPFPSTEMTMV